MGCKFYRGADKPKKIRKRFSQSYSWFRTLKWVCCKYNTHITTLNVVIWPINSVNHSDSFKFRFTSN